MACEYGPMAFGACSVAITSRMIPPVRAALLNR